jgi:hypothetical protein
MRRAEPAKHQGARGSYANLAALAEAEHVGAAEPTLASPLGRMGAPQPSRLSGESTEGARSARSAGLWIALSCASGALIKRERAFWTPQAAHRVQPPPAAREARRDWLAVRMGRGRARRASQGARRADVAGTCAAGPRKAPGAP